MKVVHKYLLDLESEQKIEVGFGFDPLHAGLDPAGYPCLWGAITPNRERSTVTVYTVGTGQTIPDTTYNQMPKHLGTFSQGIYVWHIFLKTRA